MTRYILLCRLLDCHKWQRWDVDGNYQTCARCNLTVTSTP